MNDRSAEISVAIDNALAKVVDYARDLANTAPELRGACPGVIHERIDGLAVSVVEYDAARVAGEDSPD